jgi:hypothetical protein
MTLATAAFTADQMPIEPQAGEIGDAQRCERPELDRDRRLDGQSFRNTAG